jgi:hypothetical protein
MLRFIDENQESDAKLKMVDISTKIMNYKESELRGNGKEWFSPKT